jgi:integral membrane sensor domain MASE1
VNILLVAAVLLVILHNITGYLLTRLRIKGNNLKQSLDDHLLKIKVYAAVSVAIRTLMAVCLLLFFASAIVFDARKYWILTAGIGVFVVQLTLLSWIWMGRIRQMKGIIGDLA